MTHQNLQSIVYDRNKKAAYKIHNEGAHLKVKDEEIEKIMLSGSVRGK